MEKRNDGRRSFWGWLLLVTVAAFLFVPCPVLAESLVFVRIIDEIDNANLPDLKHVKLGATLKVNKEGDMVVRCLNLFSIPVAKTPFSNSPTVQKVVQRSQLQIDQKGRGVSIKLAYMF